MKKTILVTMAMCLFMLTFVVSCNIMKEVDIELKVASDIAKFLEVEEDTVNVEVVKVTKNHYTGVATYKGGTDEEEVMKLEITLDGDDITWEIVE